MEGSSGKFQWKWNVPVEGSSGNEISSSSGSFQWKWKLPVECSGKSGNFQWNVPVKVEVPAFHWNFHFYRKLPAETSAIFFKGWDVDHPVGDSQLVPSLLGISISFREGYF